MMVALLGWCPLATAGGVHDIEFVSEHLVEVAMAHRYAALPVWPRGTEAAWEYTAQAGYSSTRTGELELSGPTFSAAAHRSLPGGSILSAFAFFDELRFSGDHDRRPLNVTFVDNVPLSLPADAEFVSLGGTARELGLGLSLGNAFSGWLDGWRWTAGVLWQLLDLSDYASPYVVLAGPSAGATGIIDYSLDWPFITPFAGVSRPIALRHWTIEPRFLLAVPLPRRGVDGRITGDGFDLSGNSADTGHSKNYGDPSPVLGLVIRYEPWGLSVDVGAALSEALLEPLYHDGVDQNIAISVAWQF